MRKQIDDELHEKADRVSDHLCLAALSIRARRRGEQHTAIIQGSSFAALYTHATAVYKPFGDGGCLGTANFIVTLIRYRLYNADYFYPTHQASKLFIFISVFIKIRLAVSSIADQDARKHEWHQWPLRICALQCRRVCCERVRLCE